MAGEVATHGSNGVKGGIEIWGVMGNGRRFRHMEPQMVVALFRKDFGCICGLSKVDNASDVGRAGGRAMGNGHHGHRMRRTLAGRGANLGKVG